jgi:hypothetical protein
MALHSPLFRTLIKQTPIRCPGEMPNIDATHLLSFLSASFCSSRLAGLFSRILTSEAAIIQKEWRSNPITHSSEGPSIEAMRRLIGATFAAAATISLRLFVDAQVIYSATDLHPVNYVTSRARGASSGHQAGQGTLDGRGRALLWFGTAESVIDLTPAGYTISSADAIDGNMQGGFAYNGSQSHAMLW